ncbi:MAG: hydroxymethylglutaryl-CoA reductase, degradative [Deltaproteobacteria bacterium]|nr:hydroxymethylglutaryl-CoA reductase, degradative [Deltaproteobacteria bacterium]
MTFDLSPRANPRPLDVSDEAPSRGLVSRIPGFYTKTLAERLEQLFELGLLSEGACDHLARGGGLSIDVADHMSENVVACHGLPLSVALNFRVQGRDVLVPMAVEEPSVVAAASNAARLLRPAGGFEGHATEPIMTAQVQFDDVPDVPGVTARVEAHRAEILRLADEAIPGMVRRGGGARDLEVRVPSPEHDLVVVHLYVHVGDAMGANIVDSVAEAVAPRLAELVGGRRGLRILTNLPLRRRVSVRARVSSETLGGEEVADAIARASRFAELDPYRAVTHNKGFMNGVDAVAVALGQDFRSLEAGAHAYASLSGRYLPLATWRRTSDGLSGEAELPMAVGTVGGATGAHPGVRVAFELLAVDSARELALVMASAGLASNLAALRALATEGIQRGHMRLHARKSELRETAGGER